MKTKTLYVTAYPYASQTGALEIPPNLAKDDIQSYVQNHWKEINFNPVELDYAGTDFDWDTDD